MLSEQASDNVKCPLNISVLVPHKRERLLNTSVLLTVYAQWGFSRSRHMGDMPKAISLGYPYGFIRFEVLGSQSSMGLWCVVNFDLAMTSTGDFEVKRRCKIKVSLILRMNYQILKRLKKTAKKFKLWLILQWTSSGDPNHTKVNTNAETHGHLLIFSMNRIFYLNIMKLVQYKIFNMTQC